MTSKDCAHAADPEYRPSHPNRPRVASSIVCRCHQETIAATTDFELSVAIALEATRLARDAFRKRREAG